MSSFLLLDGYKRLGRMRWPEHLLDTWLVSWEPRSEVCLNIILSGSRFTCRCLRLWLERDLSSQRCPCLALERPYSSTKTHLEKKTTRIESISTDAKFENISQGLGLILESTVTDHSACVACVKSNCSTVFGTATCHSCPLNNTVSTDKYLIGSQIKSRSTERRPKNTRKK